MNKRARSSAMIAAGVWTLCIPLPLSAAQAGKSGSAAQQPPAAQEDQELEEILVEGRKPLKKPAVVREWLTRLPGRFVVDGTVVLFSEGNPREPLAVQGRTNCEGFSAPAVSCELKLSWPDTPEADATAVLGAISKLDPAVLVYTYDDQRVRVRHMLVDNEGIAESAVGFLYDSDTLVTRNKCVNVPGDCQRTVRVIADPDLRQVEMRIDVEIEAQPVVRFRFLLHRTGPAPTTIR